MVENNSTHTSLKYAGINHGEKDFFIFYDSFEYLYYESTAINNL